MAEETKDSPSVAVASAPSNTEGASSTTPVPDAVTVTDPAKVETSPAPVTAPEPAKTEAAVEAPKAEAPKTETLLGAEKKPEVEKVETKPEAKEEPKAEAEQKSEAKPEEVKSPEYELKLPEGFQADPEKIKVVNSKVGELETKFKVPHDEAQGLAQWMADTHIAEMKRYNETLMANWDKQKTDWKNSFLKDPEFANRTDTVVNSAIDAINVFAGNSDQQKEFRNLMESSGIGNHPAMIRLLSNIMIAKADPKPLAAPTIATEQKVSKYQKMYGVKK